MSRPDHPTTAGVIRNQMLAKLSATVGTPDMVHVDREIIPLIAELLTLGPGNDNHPTVIQLFEWLVDPKTTVEEFSYVIGPLEHHVFDIMEEHFNSYLHDEDMGCCIYLGKVAAEALALRRPVLEGSWETAAWFLGRLNNSYFCTTYGFASKRFSTWIISVIGDPILCPSPYLRIELINLFNVMADLNPLNWNQALTSVLSACSNLNMDYLTGGGLTGFYNMDLDAITVTLEMFSSECDGYMFVFDESLSKRLDSDVNSRVSDMLHDVAYNHSSYPHRYKEQMEVHALTALLNTTAAIIRLELKRFQNDGLYQGQWINLTDLSHSLKLLFHIFELSLQMPQLLEVASSCIMDLVELVLVVNLAMITDRNEIYMQCMINTDELLE